MFGILKFYTHWPFIKICRVSNKEQISKLDKQLTRLEQRIQRATLDGEDGWFLQLERHAKRGKC